VFKFCAVVVLSRRLLFATVVLIAVCRAPSVRTLYTTIAKFILSSKLLNARDIEIDNIKIILVPELRVPKFGPTCNSEWCLRVISD